MKWMTLLCLLVGGCAYRVAVYKPIQPRPVVLHSGERVFPVTGCVEMSPDYLAAFLLTNPKWHITRVSPKLVEVCGE